MQHPRRGEGVIRLSLGREGRLYGVHFDNGEEHAYSAESAAKLSLIEEHAVTVICSNTGALVTCA